MTDEQFEELHKTPEWANMPENTEQLCVSITGAIIDLGLTLLMRDIQMMYLDLAPGRNILELLD